MYTAEVLSLRDQLDEAQEEIRQLKELFLPKRTFPASWGLTKAEAAILAALYAYPAGAPMPKEALHHAVSDDGETHPKIVDVFLCKMRKKVAPLGIVIKTVWGRGHYLPTESRNIIRDIISLQQAA